MAFHRAVAIASHNLSLARIVISVHNKAARYWYHTLTLQPDEDCLEDIASHRVVAQAIARGDGRAAMQAMIVVMGEKNAR
jgi:DNA-binding FadR family transcriptional regulator